MSRYRLSQRLWALALRRRGGASAIAALSVIATVCIPPTGWAAGDAVRGEKLYQGCKACHVPGKNTIGPMHDGVYGSKAGAMNGYDYSLALKTSGVVWDDDALDRWLANPQAFIPGSKMFYRVGVSKDRSDIIDFLKAQKARE
jgi:cytochrome c